MFLMSDLFSHDPMPIVPYRSIIFFTTIPVEILTKTDGRFDVLICVIIIPVK